VMTAGGMISRKQDQRCRLSVNGVHVRKLRTFEIERYGHTGEPEDKAGAYGIQGKGAMFIEHLSGSYSGVMGLPLFETAELLQEFGVQLL
ncbi:MAG: Maf family protein, partial [Gammaproteobacteria bacterium]|nr:Maf family protein [Gammaproteobacteria bacterium]